MPAVDTELRERAGQVIPNGMYGHMATGFYPEGVPQYYVSSQGTRLTDADGRVLIDCMSAYGPNLLGYNDPAVLAAIERQLRLGDTMSGPSPLMVTLAEAMVGLITGADWAMFCKNGSDATSMALMMARAHQGKSKILVGRHTYHGAQNWSTPRIAGILPSDRAHLIYFNVLDPEDFETARRAAGDDLAGVIVTPFRHETFESQADYLPGFARRLREVCDEADAVLILDEVRTGMRLAAGCAWDAIGVTPDLVCWGKVLGNGQPISAVTGTNRLRRAAEAIYVTGSFWFSAVPMAAALETLRQVSEGSYLERIRHAGQKLRSGLAEQAAAFGFQFSQSGPAVMPLFHFEDDPELRRVYRFCQIAAANGVLLSPYHNMFMNAAMTDTDISAILKATEIAFEGVRRDAGALPEPPPVVVARLEALRNAA